MQVVQVAACVGAPGPGAQCPRQGTGLGVGEIQQTITERPAHTIQLGTIRREKGRPETVLTSEETQDNQETLNAK